jgi:hypothetical protein
MIRNVHLHILSIPDPGPRGQKGTGSRIRKTGANGEMIIQNTVPRPAVFLWVDIVDCDDGVLDSGLVIVGVGLSPHAEGVGLEAGHAEHGVIPKN